MRIPRLSHVVIAILVVCLVGLSVLVAPHFRANASSDQTSVASHAAHPGISTNCPPPGTANAAFMPSIKLGTHPNIVYIVNEFAQGQPTFGTLKRYDVVTGSKVEVIKFAKTQITEAQVSGDGQWLMFVARGSGQNKLQLVRMDGQFLQTLYCGAPGQVQWSPAKRLVLFSDGGTTIYLLDVTTGSLQVEISTGGAFVFFNPRTWLDTTRAYLTLQRGPLRPETLVLLDTSKGPHQNFQTLPVVFDASSSTPFCWDFDSSYDARNLFTSQCAVMPPPRPDQSPVPCCGPSVIANHSPTGGPAYSYVYVNQAQAFTAVRAVTSNTLLFTVANGNGDTSQNGLWKVGTDGSSPLRLTTSGTLNRYTQFPWSNVSRDGTRYALLTINFTPPSTTTYTLEYGSLSGGSPVVFASITNVELETVGWTTM